MPAEAGAVGQEHPGGELDAFAGGIVGDAVGGGHLLAGVVEEFPHEVELGGRDVRGGWGRGVVPEGVEPLFEVEVRLAEAAGGVQGEGLVAGFP